MAQARRPTGRRVGRPALVTPERLREALLELSGEDEQLSMETVAARLGVSASTLYQHVRGREDLEHRVAEVASSELLAPEDRGQHWALWCFECFSVMRDALMQRPELLQGFRVSHPGGLERLEAMLGVLDRSGFSLHQAELAVRTLSNWLHGWVDWALEDIAVHASRSTLRDRLAEQPPRKFPRCAKLLDPTRKDRVREPFDDQLWLVLQGIAALRGELLPASYEQAEKSAAASRRQ